MHHVRPLPQYLVGRYHGWKYDGEGQCVEMPAEDPSFPPKVKILHYPAVDYGLLVFAYMGEGDAPAFELPRKDVFEDPERLIFVREQTWPCHWLQQVEKTRPGKGSMARIRLKSSPITRFFSRYMR